MTSPSPLLIVVLDVWHQDDTGTQVDRFARELASDGLVSPRVVSIGSLAKEPSDSLSDALFLVFDELGAADALAAAASLPVETVERRLFAVGVTRRRDSIDVLERSGGPGCIESRRFFVWETESAEDDPPGGVFGRKDVAHKAGAWWESPALWESEHYAMLYHDGYPTLPRLLAAYLAQFAAITRSRR